MWFNDVIQYLTHHPWTQVFSTYPICNDRTERVLRGPKTKEEESGEAHCSNER